MTEGPKGAGLPEEAYAAALACLPAVGPKWLVTTLGLHRPRQAWRLVQEGSLRLLPSSARSAPQRAKRAQDWSAWAAGFDVATFWARCRSQRTVVTWPGWAGYPEALARSASPAGVLFVAGNVEALGTGKAVALVGTRQCSSEAASVAFEMGYELARAGVCVVSGLALGIDGAAHAGAITAARELAADQRPTATTVGVAASGVDVVYPARHAQLWREVARLGAVISETPLGYPAQSWRFPSRNRIIAGLVALVVVVECPLKGGSWHTVDAAQQNGTEVAAVPGSVKNAAAYGTNKLIRDGATPVRHAQDILDSIGCFDAVGPAGTATAVGEPVDSVAARGAGQARALDDGALGPVDKEVFRALSGRPLSIDDLIERSRLPATAVVVALDNLLCQGLAAEDAGWWARA